MHQVVKWKKGEKAEYLETNKCRNLERVGDRERAPSFFSLKVVNLNFKLQVIRKHIHRMNA